MTIKSSIIKHGTLGVLGVFAMAVLPTTAAVGQEVSPAGSTSNDPNMPVSGLDAGADEAPSVDLGRDPFSAGGRLVLTGGVSQVEGAGGGGLTPWALISGHGTRDQLGATAFATGVNTNDFSLSVVGGSISYGNRIEVSIARQSFNLNAVGAALGLGRTYSIRQTIIGAKVRLFGDAVLEQDSLLPQVSAGVQYKMNDDRTVLGVLGAASRSDADYYVSATKIILSQSLLLNATARLTRANQFGILGFGSASDNSYALEGEASAAVLLNRHLAVGGEVRTKPDQLGFKEDTAYDLFVAYAPNRNVSLTVAYADLGNIALRGQRGVYASLQLSF